MTGWYAIGMVSLSLGVKEGEPMKYFEIFGPQLVPIHMENNSRRINEKELNDFWIKTDSDFHSEFGKGKISNKNGCYIFCRRIANTIWPYYVGKTWRGFRDEAFNPYQLNKYNSITGEKGNYVMLFVFKKDSRANESVASKKIIKELETFLIQTAFVRNSDLLNTHGTKGSEWIISGVTGDFSPGPDPEKIKKFNLTMGL